MKTLEMNAYAKINLFLSVKERFKNGYHSIESFMQQVELHDTVIVSSETEVNRSADNLSTTGKQSIVDDQKHLNIDFITDSKELRDEGNNLVVRAAKLMAEEFSPSDSQKIKIELNKRIPIAAGLAGGSSDAAATILALNKMWEIDANLGELMDLGKRIGADVPFCIMANAKSNTNSGFVDNPRASTAAVATGIGENLLPVTPFDGWAILIKPSLSVSTGGIYEKVSIENYTPNTTSKELTEAIIDRDFPIIRQNLYNVLETVSLREYPVIADTKNILREMSSSDLIMMTGSGPTLFVLYSDERVALKDFSVVSEELKKRIDEPFEVYLAETM